MRMGWGQKREGVILARLGVRTDDESVVRRRSPAQLWRGRSCVIFAFFTVIISPKDQSAVRVRSIGLEKGMDDMNGMGMSMRMGQLLGRRTSETGLWYEGREGNEGPGSV